MKSLKPQSARDSIVDETHQVSTYALKVPSFSSGAKWTLQANVRREGGTRFAGYFFLLPAESPSLSASGSAAGE
jgi:hypothetical protein